MRPKYILSACLLLLLSIDQGDAQWIPQSLPGDVTMLLSIDFVDANIGAASGYMFDNVSSQFNGRSVYTTDGGTTWLFAAVPGSSRSLVTMKFVDRNTGYIAGAENVAGQRAGAGCTEQWLQGVRRISDANSLTQFNLLRVGLQGNPNFRGMFLKSTDAGHSWFSHGTLPDSVSYLFGASFVNPAWGYVTGYATDGGVLMLKTTDGGLTWSRLPIPDSILQLPNVAFADTMNGIAVGAAMGMGGLILRTTSGGASWELTTHLPVVSFVDVSFSTPATAFACGTNANITPAVYKTTDAGESWSVLNTVPETANLSGIRANGSLCVAYGNRLIVDTLGGLQYREEFIMTSTDGGSIWTSQLVTSLPEFHVPAGGKMVTELNGYISGGDPLTAASVLHTTNGGATWVREAGSSPPRQLTLEQNYPNPFNPATTISYNLTKPERVSLRVYDILGREVATLVDGEIREGHNTVTWNAGGLGSGVYVFILNAGRLSESQKLVLTK